MAGDTTDDEDRYLESLHRMTTSRYRLFEDLRGRRTHGGCRRVIMTNVYHGRDLWVFELVTDEPRRSSGHGQLFLEYLTSWAEDAGSEKMAMSSGLQRSDAHRFYEENVGMDRASYVFTMNLA